MMYPMNFLITNKPKLGNNHRLTMIYKALDKKTEEQIKEITYSSKKFLEHIRPSAKVIDGRANML